MNVWFWGNVLLTILALTFVRLNACAPHRLRFLVCFVAMCCWLLPWNFLSQIAPAPRVPIEIFSAPQSLSVAGQTVSPAITESAGIALARVSGMVDTLLLVGTLIGVLLFSISCLRYLRFLKRLSHASGSGDDLMSRLSLASRELRRNKRQKIRIQREVPGALTTGVFFPTVWIHEDMLASPNLEAALIHEFTHARNHDNAYLWVMTLVQRVFWWNPLVQLLGCSARRLQELSCDEACERQLIGYRDMLNRLIVTLSVRGEGGGISVPQASGVHGNGNFNVQRIRALERRNVMKIRHYASTAMLLLVSAFVLGCATALDEGIAQESGTFGAPPAFESVDEAISALGAGVREIPGLDTGISMEEANEAYRSLGLYARLLEGQYDEQEAEIIRLRNELEELRRAIAGVAAASNPPVTGPDGDYRLMVETSPVYPPRALAREFEGYVIVEYTITETGQTANLAVVESTSSLFDRPAIEAVQRYEYRPRIIDGVGVAVSGVRTRVEFKLPE